MKSGIYQIKNLINNKVYIGSAVNIISRVNYHFYQLENNNHHSFYLQKSFNKHGKANFKFSVLEYLDDKNSLIEREQYYLNLHYAQEFIRKENNLFRKLTYNMNPTAGSSYGRKVSKKSINKRKLSYPTHPEYVRIKISKKLKGRIESEETRKRKSVAFKGKVVSQETRDKLSKSKKGKNLGKIISIETRIKISKALKGKNTWMKGKKLTQESINKRTQTRLKRGWLKKNRYV